MPSITRRSFAALTLAITESRTLHAATLDAKLAASVKRHNIPACAAMVAGPDRTLYQGAFGRRDSHSSTPVSTQSIFRIASMTKAVTAVASMQLVERRKWKLDDPVGKYLPELEQLQVPTAPRKMAIPSCVPPRDRFCCGICSPTLRASPTPSGTHS